MLVIRRRAGEAIVIDGGIEIRVLEVGANRVKLGVAAPAEIGVVRKEVVESRAQNQAAANPSAAGLEALARGLRLAAPPPPEPTR
jgi:carbon storage regulator